MGPNRIIAAEYCDDLATSLQTNRLDEIASSERNIVGQLRITRKGEKMLARLMRDGTRCLTVQIGKNSCDFDIEFGKRVKKIAQSKKDFLCVSQSR